MAETTRVCPGCQAVLRFPPGGSEVINSDMACPRCGARVALTMPNESAHIGGPTEPADMELTAKPLLPTEYFASNDKLRDMRGASDDPGEKALVTIDARYSDSRPPAS